MLAPITHGLPPRGYGPWEQVVSDLTERLVGEGHQVTLFGPEGTETTAALVATVPYPLDEWPADRSPPDRRVWEELHIATVVEEAAAGRFDIVHSHLHVHPLGYARFLPVPLVTTLHGTAWNQGIHPALGRYRSLPFVSISEAERRFFPALSYVATVYNGIDCDRFPPGEGGGGYLLFAGRLAPEKAPHLAIEVARRAGQALKMAGLVEERHRPYFEARVLPEIDGRRIEYLGSVDRSTLAGLLREAAALVMPLSWDEPFGLVAVEALSSGTPVIGWRRGALPELVQPGVTGELVDDVAGAVRAVSRIGDLDRTECRRVALDRFSAGRMAAGYLSVYRTLIEG